MKQSEKSGRVQIPGRKEEPRDDDELPVFSLRSCWPKDFLGGVDETRLASYVIRKILIFFSSSSPSFLFCKRYSSFVPHPLANLKKVLGSSSQSSLNCCLGS